MYKIGVLSNKEHLFAYCYSTFVYLSIDKSKEFVLKVEAEKQIYRTKHALNLF